MLLEVNDVSLSLRRDGKYSKILDHVSFQVNKGETVGIVGESGCGKSMTALSLMRLLPDKAKLEGSVELQGEKITNYSKRKLEKVRGNQMSMIFQNPLTSLNPLQTVGTQIEESLILHTNMSKKERRVRVLKLLNDVGLPRVEELIDEYPHQLSGGMRQRIMIAIAMACEPQLLICDEPTTALDVTVQAQILELMNEIKEQTQMGIIMITHDMGVVAEVCDRVIVMYAGKVVEEAPVVELFQNPKHPYTRGLLNSIPKLGQRKQKLGSIPGTVPVPENMPVGCRFADRCSHVMDICKSTVPQVTEIKENHQTACWLYDEEGGNKDATTGSNQSQTTLHY
ncbi:ABC transporter ATP-binding protein [Aquibacillus koreensis]|uniref:ABC transporter ATP-binding protein n=1 Tax=Aquibacillus koreensis TaxID=279446 RepID=A0A9X4AHP4_9BACI|nr:ABC transporter ATP-binding protein [Aquibacillus koreensis]MCT2537098.1 ABC transporter ATP-binding protein [Aquibacillus koreensis]MDC3419919.1 ABC transporter ATP-binding protein [Aquibacillus koreensis]